jgi:hypothetical protein
MDNLTPTKLALISRRAREDSKFLQECYQSLGKENADGIKFKFILMQPSREID